MSSAIVLSKCLESFLATASATLIVFCVDTSSIGVSPNSTLIKSGICFNIILYICFIFNIAFSTKITIPPMTRLSTKKCNSIAASNNFTKNLTKSIAVIIGCSNSIATPTISTKQSKQISNKSINVLTASFAISIGSSIPVASSTYANIASPASNVNSTNSTSTSRASFNAAANSNHDLSGFHSFTTLPFSSVLSNTSPVASFIQCCLIESYVAFTVLPLASLPVPFQAPVI